VKVEWIAWNDGISSLIGAYGSFNPHIRAQHHLTKIISEFQRIKAFDRREMGHHNLITKKSKQGSEKRRTNHYHS
jgi:hypothetical protein